LGDAGGVNDSEKWRARLGAAVGEPDLLIGVADQALRYADRVGADADFRIFVLQARAAGYRESETGRRDERLAAALNDYEAVLALTAEEDHDWPGRALNVAVAIGEQVQGDQMAAARSAEKLLRRALAKMSETERPDLAAMLRTNLALALMRSQPEGGTTRLEEARALCEQALQYRSPARDAEDWAYTTINLGAIVERLHYGGAGSLSDAAELYRSVMAHADETPGLLVSHAQLNLLRLLTDECHRESEQQQDVAEQERRRAELFALATQIVHNPHASQVTRGRAQRTLGMLARERGDEAGARSALEQAIELLTGGEPRDLHHAAWELATIHCEAEDWHRAAESYRIALTAGAFLIESPRDSSERARQANASGRLWRWAAHAFMMSGALEEAALTLENGRTRELRRQLNLEDPIVAQLEAAAPEALAAWREAQRDLAEQTKDLDLAGAAYEQALADIHSIRGFERFAAGAELEDIRAAAREGSPVIYVNVAPAGGSLIRVGASGPVERRTLETTSSEVISWILFGLSDPARESLGDAVSYGLAAAGSAHDMEPGRSPPDIAPALDRLLPWVGERISRAVHGMLAKHGDRDVLLVMCGPLAGVPLAAAPYGDEGRCLLDSFTVTVTPSASAHAAARRRGAARTPAFERIVAVADPTGDLPFTRTEVGQVVGLFGSSELALGSQASKRWVFDHLAHGTVLHLACHGYGGLLDGAKNGLILADGVLSGAELATIGPLRARLAVASACQTAVIGVGDGGEEAFSLGSAFLAAGAACAIASLWSVDDLATAMLMTRVYEKLAAGLEPAAALVSAQRWLRDLDDARAAEFLTRHPQLRAIPSAKRGSAATTAEHEQDRPFAHPVFWAAFVTMGA
jgi:hypothetical protein